MASPKSSKRSKRAALAKLMRRVPQGEAIFRILVGLGDRFWESDSDKDRTAAIMGAIFLEHALKAAICHHLKSDPDDPEFKYLFEADDAPYREFAGRVRLARAQGIITKEEYEQLEAIRLIRNAFAHTMDELTFQTPEIAAYCDELKIIDESEGFQSLVDAFAPKHTLLGMMPGGRANRMAFAHAVFLFYWKLTNYPPIDWSNFSAIATNISSPMP
jgi:DNA-binding MltR family transcriptional regulator